MSPTPPTLTDYDADVVLRDGSTVHVRRLRDADVRGLLTFFEHLSPESRYTPQMCRELILRETGSSSDCLGRKGGAS